MATATTEMSQKLETDILHHPTVSPDFTSSNFHIFRLLKDVLHGRKFSNDEEVKDTVHT
jgi:hypothetical protein